MNRLKVSLITLTLLSAGTMAGCSGTSASADVSGSVRKSLDAAGLMTVSVSQDREKGVVTLAGHVTTASDKVQAESLARALAGPQVVADQIAVLPPGLEKETKAVNTDLDEGIEKSLDAALIQSKLEKRVKYEVKSGVVTLNGEVRSEHERTRSEEVATQVPNVQQVVNNLQITEQKASSSQ